MTIKCPKSTMILLCSNYFLAGIAIVLKLQCDPGVLSNGTVSLLSIICSALFLYASASSAIYFGKTIKLSEEGCTIEFLFLKKFYPWSHYETKLYQKVYGRKTAAVSIRATILFLPRFLWETKSPIFWCQFLYPFSGVCLAFQPQRATKVFEINENALILLQQWDIEIRGLATPDIKE